MEFHKEKMRSKEKRRYKLIYLEAASSIKACPSTLEPGMLSNVAPTTKNLKKNTSIPIRSSPTSNNTMT